MAGKWAVQHPHVRIGMLQSGLAGFVAPNIVNLDGKVNPAALKARQQGQLGKYIEDERLDYIVDMRDCLRQIFDQAPGIEAQYPFLDSIGNVGIHKRRIDSAL
jgi:hypothetical protein